MSKLDDAIREALSSDEAEQLEKLAAPQGLFGQITSVVQSNMGGWAWYGIFIQVIALGLAFWTGWNFYFAETGREMALWGFGCGLSIMFQSFIKIWFLSQMDKQEILREIKRLELQVALLARQTS